MAYRLRTDEVTATGVTRIAVKQIELAIFAFSDKRLDREQAIHQARQSCKKCRALLQLLGNTNSEMAKVGNACIRDAARMLARMRDLDALPETFDALRKRATQRISLPVLNEVRQAMTQRRPVLGKQETQEESQIEGFIADMGSLLNRVESWAIELDGASDLMPGFAKAYRRGRRAMKACRHSPSNEAFHDWRKWTKYQLYQTLVLKSHLKDSLKHRLVGLTRLGKLLGVDHDLAVLRHELVEAPDFRTARDLVNFGDLLQALDRRRTRLQKQALKLGKRLYTPGIKKRLGRPA